MSARKRFARKALRPLLAIAAAALLFASCSSTGVKTEAPPPQTEVVEPRIAHPYEFFDFNKDAYVTFPVNGNEELFTALVRKIAPTITKLALSQLTSKTNYFYLASNLDFFSAAKAEGSEGGQEASAAGSPVKAAEGERQKKLPLLQFCATGSFPLSYCSMLFTKGNGFREVKEKQQGRTYNYFYNEEAGLFIDMPVAGYCFADTEYLSGMLLAREQTLNGKVYTPEWPDEVMQLMFSQDGSSDINWFISNADPLVQVLLGESVRLPLSYAFGAMRRLEGAGADSLLYEVEATLETTDKRFVRPNVAVLGRFLQAVQPAQVASAITPEATAGEGCDIHISGWVVDLSALLARLGAAKNGQ